MSWPLKMNTQLRRRIAAAWILIVTASTYGVALAQTPAGLKTVASPFGVAETMERIEAAAKARGLTIFAKIDHSGEAQKSGMTMKPTQLLVLGNPKGGTPAMNAAPSVAIDLPLKVLVAEGADGKTQVTLNDADFLRSRHKVPDDLAKPFGALLPLVEAALK